MNNVDELLEGFKGFGLQKQDDNVTKNRNIYVGGSDVPTILGINQYKTQYELALEKTGLKKREFITNQYIQFGNMLEPMVREYVNAKNGTYFIEETYVDNVKGIRSNVDGIDKEENILLEIKTHGKNPTHNIYEAQMQMYMYQSGATHGWLALYERPSDFDVNFDSKNLQIQEIERDEEAISNILDSIETFWIRCEFLKDNPDMTEKEFLTTGTDIDKALAKLNDLAPTLIEAKEFIKKAEAEEKAIKDFLYKGMDENNIKKLSTPLLNITRILPSTTNRFDSKQFKEDHPELHEQYLKQGVRKGYVRLTEVKQDET